MGNNFDFNRCPLRQGGDLHRRARGEIRGEMPAINFVHCREVREICHEDRALDDVEEGQLLVLEDRVDISQGALGLCLRWTHCSPGIST